MWIVTMWLAISSSDVATHDPEGEFEPVPWLEQRKHSGTPSSDAPLFAAYKMLSIKNEKSEHITLLDNIVRIIMRWSERRGLNPGILLPKKPILLFSVVFRGF